MSTDVYSHALEENRRNRSDAFDEVLYGPTQDEETKTEIPPDLLAPQIKKHRVIEYGDKREGTERP